MQELPGSEMATDDIDELVHVVSQTFCPMECHTPARRLNARLGQQRLDNTRIASVASNALDVIRSNSHIAQATDAYYLVKFQLNGKSRVCHRSHEIELNVGDFVICSSTDPYELHFPSSYAQAVLCIPQYQLDELVHNPHQYLGKKMQGDEPVNGMLTQFVGSLVTRIDQLSAVTLQRMENNVLDLLITSLQAHSSATVAQSETVQQEHLNRIKQFIAMHLKDSRLSPDFIAEAEGIGTRYLHMLFKHEPLSVSRYIKAKRLKMCCRALIDPNRRHLSTTEIAYECGFNDVSHFHRCFKSEYGMTPRQYRLNAN